MSGDRASPKPPVWRSSDDFWSIVRGRLAHGGIDHEAVDVESACRSGDALTVFMLSVARTNWLISETPTSIC